MKVSHDGPLLSGHWAVVFGEDTPDQVLVNIHAKCFIDLLVNSKTSKAWVELL